MTEEEQYELEWLRGELEKKDAEISRLSASLLQLHEHGAKGKGSDPHYDGYAYYPQGKPTSRELRIPLQIGKYPAIIPRDDFDAKRIPFHDVRLRATTHCLQLPDGQRVVWYGWEIY